MEYRKDVVRIGEGILEKKGEVKEHEEGQMMKEMGE